MRSLISELSESAYRYGGPGSGDIYGRDGKAVVYFNPFKAFIAVEIDGKAWIGPVAIGKMNPLKSQDDGDDIRVGIVSNQNAMIFTGYRDVGDHGAGAALFTVTLAFKG